MACSQHRFEGAGTEVGIWVDPFNIQIMHKPESEDEEQERTLE